MENRITVGERIPEGEISRGYGEEPHNLRDIVPLHILLRDYPLTQKELTFKMLVEYISHVILI